MENLLQELHSQFCNELNQLWLDAICVNEGNQYDSNRFNPLISRINEAKREGYEFIVERSPSFFIDHHPSDEDTEALFGTHPQWKNVSLVQKMIEASEKNQWESILPHYRSLRNKLITDILIEYAIEHVKEHGPFFVRNHTDRFYVYINTGNVAHDMSLIAFIYGRSATNGIIPF